MIRKDICGHCFGSKEIPVYGDFSAESYRITGKRECPYCHGTGETISRIKETVSETQLGFGFDMESSKK